MTIEHLNHLIHLFGESQKHDMRVEKRAAMTSPLFDLPRRSLLGWTVLYDHQVGFLRELVRRITPEEIGRRMRRVGARPHGLQPFVLVSSHLMVRQQRMLDLGLAEGDRFPEENLDDIAFLMDFWERLQRSYRSDGKLLPAEAEGSVPILDDDALADVRSRLLPLDEEERRRIRRMVATLEVFSFLLHGEQRDGIFGHGPYPLEDGSTLFFTEVNDLRNDYLPWAPRAQRNVYDDVAVAYRARDIHVVFTMYGGTATVTPLEFDDRILELAVLTNLGGELRTLGADHVAEIDRTATAVSDELYMTIAGWDDRYRVEYGAYLFANHLKTFFDIAGIDDGVGVRILAAARSTAERVIDDLIGGATPSIWKHMGTTQGDFYWPVVPG